MKNNSAIIITNTIVILLLQIFIFNNVLLFSRFHPYIYMFIILFLPAGTNKSIVMLAGFVIGFVIDIFSYTYGMHAAATTIMAFLRVYLLSFLFETDDENKNQFLNPELLSYRVYITYILTMIFVHHLLLFTIEAGGLNNFGRTIFVVIISTIFSASLILIYELASRFRKP